MVKMILRHSAFGLLAVLAGCRAYEPSPVDWTAEAETWLKTGELTFASLDDVERVAVVGNMEPLVRCPRGLLRGDVEERHLREARAERTSAWAG